MLYIITLIKLKLLLRNEFDSKKIKFNYMLIFFPFYFILLRNVFLFNNFFYGFTILCIVILGLDYHTVINNSNFSTLKIFNIILNKKKSLNLAFLSDLFLKMIVLLPFVFLINYKFYFLFLSIFFFIFSFLLKEIVSMNMVNKKIYILFIFISIFGFSLLGGLFLDFTKKILSIIEYTNTFFYYIYIYTICINLFIIVFLSIVFLKKIVPLNID
jgi:hypothetical protein